MSSRRRKKAKASIFSRIAPNLLAIVIGGGLLAFVVASISAVVSDAMLDARLEQVGGNYAQLSGWSSETVTISDGTIIRFDASANDQSIIKVRDDLRRCKKLVLKLGGTAVGDKGLEQLSGADNILALDISNSRITDNGLAHVATLSNLIELSLHDNLQLTDASLTHVAKLTDLRKLGLSHTRVTDRGLTALHGFRHLGHVTVGWGEVTPAGADALRFAMPNTEVRRIGPPFDDALAGKRITAATGIPIPDDGEPWIGICRTYFAALHQRDRFTCKSLWSENVSVSFSSISEDQLSISPTRIIRFGGFANDTSATVFVVGPTPQESRVRYDVHLVFEDNEWRLSDVKWIVDAWN